MHYTCFLQKTCDASCLLPQIPIVNITALPNNHWNWRRDLIFPKSFQISPQCFWDALNPLWPFLNLTKIPFDGHLHNLNSQSYRFEFLLLLLSSFSWIRSEQLYIRGNIKFNPFRLCCLIILNSSFNYITIWLKSDDRPICIYIHNTKN